jgi:hypothetical protein
MMSDHCHGGGPFGKLFQVLDGPGPHDGFETSGPDVPTPHAAD